MLTTANTTAASINLRNRFIDIIDFLLGPGQYSIVADGYSIAEANGNVGLGGGGPNVDTGGGLIAFTGTARFGASTAGFVFPGTIDGGPANRYDAGIFQFTAVPEPASVTLAIIGLIGLGASRRKQHG